ncbi:MAG: hypothetical protein BWY31_02027 [Lentisphaerae bacterium ADurb.Bin242]|nr:MAG: hypothetical protein BWY31_02027 [Lentisphaerae bacterium ADurb.Bin242]
MFTRQLSTFMGAVLILGTGAVTLQAAEYPLVKDGKAVSAIVVKPDVPKPVSFGAKELSKFLAKISQGETLPIREKPEAKLYNIYLGTVGDKALVKASGIDERKLRKNGFAIAAKKDGLHIIGFDGLGTLYGAYEILKKQGGIRWVYPGEDGEYFSVKKTISVPEGVSYHNPHMEVRHMRFNGCINSLPYWDTCEWMVRNNMRVTRGSNVLADERYQDHFEELGAVSFEGGHILDMLMTGRGIRPKNEVKTLEEMFRENPEFFPMVNGRRIPLEGHKYQPCTSNRQLLDIMAENLLLWTKKKGVSGYIVVGNMDGTGWCQCPECRKLDPPEEAAKNTLPTRYWTMLNYLGGKVWEKNPDAKLLGWAYQNFWMPPKGVQIDKRFGIRLSFNNECYRHAITDPKCAINAQFLKLYKEWQKLGLHVENRDEIGGGCGAFYAPSERVLYQNFKDYPSIGLAGSDFCIVPPDGVIPKSLAARSPLMAGNLVWPAMWQVNYLSACFLWDIHGDFDRLYDEANRLYYGKAWAGGMRDFRALLTKAYTETPGCMGWGQGSPLGRCLDQPGVHAKLKTYLAAAGKAAADDPRALKHVLRDKEIFALTWEAARERYVKGYREFKAYKKSAPIVIDGQFNEPDWKNADVISNFVSMDGKGAPAAQTFFRVVYEPENIYFSIEAMEPSPDKLKHFASGRDDAKIWQGDNKIEIFINHPDLASNYYHYAISSKGSMFDAFHGPGKRDNSYNSKAEYQVKTDKDRWTLEIRIPTAELGMKCFDGQSWKINVARSRCLTDGTIEQSSWANGNFHNAENFGTINFVPKRSFGRHGENTVSFWNNASFNALVKNKPGKNAGWTLENDMLPKDWGLVSQNGILKMKLHPGSAENCYAEFGGGFFRQWHLGTGKSYQIHFRASGHGEMAVSFARHQPPKPNTPGRGPVIRIVDVATVNVDSDEWKNFKFPLVKEKDEEQIAVGFRHIKGTVNIDDCTVGPAGE